MTMRDDVNKNSTTSILLTIAVIALLVGNIMVNRAFDARIEALESAQQENE